MSNPKLNGEGYYDPTAYQGMKGVIKEEAEIQNKVNKLITVLKLVIDLAGFDLTARIQIKHKKSGKEFK